MRRPNFDFIGKRNWWFAFSGVLVAVSIVALFVSGINYGIDFQGGTLIDVRLEKAASVQDVRKVLGGQGLADSTVQVADVESVASKGKEVLIRTEQLQPAKQRQVLESLDKSFRLDRRGTSVQTVGPGWGDNVTRGALLALGMSFFAILIYISLRFEWKMAFSAMSALVHDLVLVVGIYALVGREVTPNTIAAVLTVLGYSLYDTIVVFHRIKQNSDRMGKRTYAMMANDSINQIFVRWLNTSVIQLIPVISLLIFGGETLKDFAFALMIGIMSGTYSSIFFASPLLVVLKESEPRFKTLRKKYGNMEARA
ncbi:MAG: protein translocase subunit SecF [Actinobacteria bacterium]|nr:MAG: protein translocase subunit SecF [Actinomycetota bacterium]